MERRVDGPVNDASLQAGVGIAEGYCRGHDRNERVN